MVSTLTDVCQERDASRVNDPLRSHVERLLKSIALFRSNGYHASAERNTSVQLYGDKTLDSLLRGAIRAAISGDEIVLFVIQRANAALHVLIALDCPE
jgi:hypothetical protein